MFGVVEAGVVHNGVGIRVSEVDANPVVVAGVVRHGVEI